MANERVTRQMSHTLSRCPFEMLPPVKGAPVAFYVTRYGEPLLTFYDGGLITLT